MQTREKFAQRNIGFSPTSRPDLRAGRVLDPLCHDVPGELCDSRAHVSGAAPQAQAAHQDEAEALPGRSLRDVPHHLGLEGRQRGQQGRLENVGTRGQENNREGREIMHGLAPQSVRGRIKGCLFLNKLTKKEKIMESRKPGIRGKGGGGVTKVWSLWGRKCLSKISNPPSYPLYFTSIIVASRPHIIYPHPVFPNSA